MQFLFLLLVIRAAALAIPVKKEEEVPLLEGAKIFRVIPETDEKLSSIIPYEGQKGYDFLEYSENIGEPIDVLVTADNVEHFQIFLDKFDIENFITVENVQKAVDEEALRQKSTSGSFGDFSFTVYHRYHEMYNYMRKLASNHSDIVSLKNIGSSFEGRDIYALKISSSGYGNKKPAVFMECGIHAREWISSAVCLYVIDQLLKNDTNSDLVKKVDWHIVPMINPDGYEYTHTSYRLWRKTRSVNKNGTHQSGCRGVDLNRNFDINWMGNGSSNFPCSSVYAGDKPFSEPETQALRDYVLNHDNIKLSMSFHSYGNSFLYPWGYTKEEPKDAPKLNKLAKAAAKALASYRGTKYNVGSGSNLLYYASGLSTDWMKAVAGINLAYGMMLSGGGDYGFDIPASEIAPVGQETLMALRFFAEHVADKSDSSEENSSGEESSEEKSSEENSSEDK